MERFPFYFLLPITEFSAQIQKYLNSKSEWNNSQVTWAVVHSTSEWILFAEWASGRKPLETEGTGETAL